MNLKEYREEHSLTQTDVAIALDISRSMISKYENREALPSPKRILSIRNFTQGKVDLVDFVENADV